MCVLLYAPIQTYFSIFKKFTFLVFHCNISFVIALFGWAGFGSPVSPPRLGLLSVYFDSNIFKTRQTWILRGMLDLHWKNTSAACIWIKLVRVFFFWERRGGKRPRETEDQLQIPLNINKKINILSAFRSQSHYLQLQANTNLFSSQSRFYIWSMEIFSYAA